MMHAERSAKKQENQNGQGRVCHQSYRLSDCPRGCFESSKSRRGFRAAALLLLGILTAGCLHTSPVYASGEKAAFGSESYEWNLGETSAVGIYATSEDAEITAVTCTVSYDTEMLTYGWGGELTEDGLVTLSGDNSGDSEYRDYIYFVPTVAGDTTLTIESMEITETDGTVVETESTEVTVSIPIPESCQLTDLSVNGETVDGFDPTTATYNLKVDADVEEAAIIASADTADVEISDTASLKTGNNTLYVMVLGTDGSTARYTLNIKRAKAASEEAAISEDTSDSDTEDTSGAAVDEEDSDDGDTDTADAQEAEASDEGGVSSMGMLLPIIIVIIVIIVIVVIVIIVIVVRRGRSNRRSDEIRERYLAADKRAEEAIRNRTIRRFDDDDE